MHARQKGEKRRMKGGVMQLATQTTARVELGAGGEGHGGGCGVPS